ncbi:MAG: hypothetical protein D3916_07785 [Candidatus Electrothrix sp. MAN1_4]|nr:hypothetical protein [Candidatus Electrothrix sp. MAN1_4]
MRDEPGVRERFARWWYIAGGKGVVICRGQGRGAYSWFPFASDASAHGVCLGVIQAKKITLTEGEV